MRPSLVDLIRVEYRLPATSPIPAWAWQAWREGRRWAG